MEILDKNRDLHYYQGYHEIVCFLYLRYENRDITLLLETISRLHLKEFMEANIDGVMENHKIFKNLLYIEDIKLFNHLEK